MDRLPLLWAVGGGDVSPYEAVRRDDRACSRCPPSRIHQPPGGEAGDRNIGGTAIDASSSGNLLLLNCNPADVNFDLAIDSGDLGYLLGLWDGCSVQNADINQDGEVNGADLAYIIGFFGGPTDDNTAP